MTSAAPASRASRALSPEAVPMTRAPRRAAIWQKSSPTPPAAAGIKHASIRGPRAGGLGSRTWSPPLYPGHSVGRAGVDAAGDRQRFQIDHRDQVVAADGDIGAGAVGREQDSRRMLSQLQSRNQLARG